MKQLDMFCVFIILMNCDLARLLCGTFMYWRCLTQIWSPSTSMRRWNYTGYPKMLPWNNTLADYYNLYDVYIMGQSIVICWYVSTILVSFFFSGDTVRKILEYIIGAWLYILCTREYQHTRSPRSLGVYW